MAGFDGVPIGGNDHAFHRVPQFPHIVAPPVIVRQAFTGLRADRFCAQPESPARHSYEVVGQPRDVRSPIAKRRDGDHVHVQPVIEIFPKPSLAHRHFEIAIRRRDHPSPHRYLAIATDAGDHPFFQHSQQLGLGRRRQFPHLVQKQGAGGGRLECTPVQPVCTGERAPLVPEQCALDEIVRQRSAVDRHERRIGRRAQAVQLPSDDFLARAALPEDEGRTGNGRQPRQRFLEPLHGGTRPHQRRRAGELRGEVSHLLSQAAAFESVLDLPHDPLDRLVLIDEPFRPETHRPHAPVEISGTRVDDHRHVDLTALQFFQHAEPVEYGHLEIQNDTIDGITREHLQTFGPAVRDDRIVRPDTRQVIGVLLGHGRHVVHDQHPHHRSPPRPSARPEASVEAGSSTRN